MGSESIALRLIGRLALGLIAPAIALCPAVASARGSETIATIFQGKAVRVSRAALNPNWNASSWPKLDRNAGPWAELIAEAKGKSKAERIALVNQWVNHAIMFEEDRDQYGEADHWSDIQQSLASGRGDCEDYAIAKLQLLRALGFSARNLYVAIVHDEELRLDHAVLIVRTPEGFVVLDNQRQNIADAQAIANYRPVLSFNSDTAWLYQSVLSVPAPQPSAAPPLRIIAGK